MNILTLREREREKQKKEKEKGKRGVGRPGRSCVCLFSYDLA